MKLICLGTSGYQPSEQRHTSCYFLPELGVLLDAGTGMFRARQRLRQPHLDILLTHAHLDHIVGLSFVLGWRELNGLQSIHVYGHPEKLGAIQEHIFSPHIFPIMPPIQWRALPENQADFELRCGARVRWWEQTHPGGSVGYRLDYGEHSLAYVTDTTAQKTDPYISHLDGVRLLIHECNFDNDQQEMAIRTGHSWLREVLDRATRCGVSKLALVHTSPYGNVHEPIPRDGLVAFQGDVVVPSDLDELEI
jgi:ribonuclease BN (tRNA processing enzyme)